MSSSPPGHVMKLLLFNVFIIFFLAFMYLLFINLNTQFIQMKKSKKVNF